MTTQRLAPNQLLVPLPLDEAREAVWQTLAEAGLQRVVIDIGRNTVTGWTRTSFLGGEGQNVTASFMPHQLATIVSINSSPQLAGTIDFGRSKRHAAKLIDRLAGLLAQDWSRTPVETSPTEVPVAAPIAAPTGEVMARPQTSGPIYAPAGPWPRGRTVLTYGIFGLLCCQIASVFAVIYGISALREYGPNDPGDKASVIVGLILGLLGTLVVLFWLSMLLIPNM
jgi:hypothetical protein